MSAQPRVVVARGHQANSWHLRPWRHLTDRYDIVALRTRRNWFDTGSMGVPVQRATALRDLLPPGRIGDTLSRVPGDRYLRPATAFEGADIVHSQDLGFWYSMQAAKLKPQLGFKLALTVWETIPFIDSYRNVRTRPYRKLVLERTDLFLATTEHAAACLALEGAPEENIRICAPGVDRALFSSATVANPAEHLVVSAGRLTWEKGHQDVMRAVALLRRRGADVVPRLLVIGDGPERDRLTAYAGELGIADSVEIRANVPYAEMPSIYAQASAFVLASLPVWSWEEQFGMVLAEAICAGVPALASTSGAIPEVGAGAVTYFSPGDWSRLADLLADGPLAKPPGTRAATDERLLHHLSSEAAAERLAAAYEELLGS